MDIKSLIPIDKFKLMFGSTDTYDSFIETAERYKINTKLRIAHFLAQSGHESAGLTKFTENLNYSKIGLLKTFSKYFNGTTAGMYEHKQMDIANIVYSNRGGNGDTKSGDGWKYRGRGAIQVTMKNNYLALSKSTGIDFVSNPDLLSTTKYALLSAGWFWDEHNLNTLADANKLDSISDIINIGHETSKIGDSNGFSDRKAQFEKYLKILG